MYHRNELEIAYIAAAAPGNVQPAVKEGPAGKRRSRDGALLKHCVADAKTWLGLDPDEEANGTTHFLVENASVDDIRDAISEAGDYVLSQRDKPHWNGGGLSIWYSGHGSAGSGAWSLNDGDLGAHELAELLGPLAQAAGGNLGIELYLDSCYSGAFFALLLEREWDAPFTARDMYISCLPDEVAWELDELGHGAMAFTLLKPGNAHVDRRRLAKAVRDRDDAYVRSAVHAFVPNPVTYLTEGDQTSFELVSGHHVDVKGAGRFELPEHFSAAQLIELITRAGEAEPE